MAHTLSTLNVQNEEIARWNTQNESSQDIDVLVSPADTSSKQYAFVPRGIFSDGLL